MADEKKKPDSWNFDFIEGATVWLFLLALIGSIVPTIIGFFTSGELTFFGFKPSRILDFFKTHILFFKTLGLILAGAAAIGTVVFNKRADAIWRVEKAKVYPENMPLVNISEEPAENPMKTRWEKIVELSESQNSSDWRLSIIEADIILDELLQKLQLPGETIGDKLKAVEKSDFNTIEAAWEAHKARNAIAHEGSGFLLNDRETRRIISLYEAVFREFEMI